MIVVRCCTRNALKKLLANHSDRPLPPRRLQLSSRFKLKGTFRPIAMSTTTDRSQHEQQSNADTDAFNALETDRFGGVTVRSANEPSDVDVAAFTSKLLKSLSKWSAEGKRTVWFHVSRASNLWLPVLCDNAFLFHRVSHDGQVVVMYRWLAADKPSAVPPYAHTMVGVGGVVLNANRELLVVLQRFGSREILKLPGGYVEPGEDLSETAVREVEEETGVKTRFVSCVSFRHTHAANFDCSDLYFVAHLEPLTCAASHQSDEVVDVRWVSVDEFMNHPQVHSLNRAFVRNFFETREYGISIVKEDGLHPVTNKPYSFYRVACGSAVAGQTK